MLALDALLNRVSVPRVGEPAPTVEQREILFRAALRAPDHGQLHPWRFLTIEGSARQRLGELFVSALLAGDPQATQAAQDKARAGPLRAPLLVALIASPQPHFKVPASEQVLSAACAAHAVLLAAHALGLGAVWRTGELSYAQCLADGLGLSPSEQLIGFLYLGTPLAPLRVPAPLDPAAFVRTWP